MVLAGFLAGPTSCRKAPATAATSADAASKAKTETPALPGQPAPPKPVPAQLPDVLARVNGEAVTKVDFDRLIKNMEARANQPIPAERRDDVYRKALDQLVTYTVLSQETRARKVTALLA